MYKLTVKRLNKETMAIEEVYRCTYDSGTPQLSKQRAKEEAQRYKGQGFLVKIVKVR